MNVFDHAVVVSRKFDKEKTEMFTKMFGNTVLVDYQPTCENLVADFAERIWQASSGRSKTAQSKLYETATSYAEWFAADNLQ